VVVTELSLKACIDLSEKLHYLLSSSPDLIGLFIIKHFILKAIPANFSGTVFYRIRKNREKNARQSINRGSVTQRQTINGLPEVKSGAAAAAEYPPINDGRPGKYKAMQKNVRGRSANFYLH
jgi:hypothetical protein